MAKSWTPTANEWYTPAANNAMGGWTRLPRVDPDSGGDLTNKANAILRKTHTDEMVGMWVNEFSADFEMVGTVAQSKDRREFFAQGFSAPTFAISGQTPNSYEYMRLAQFIRQSQLEQMRGFGDYLLQFLMPQAGPQRSLGRRQRGDHQDIDLLGYVTSVPAGAERFVTAHPYSLQFVVVKVNQFPGLNDTDHLSSVGSDPSSINQIFLNQPNDRFVSTVSASMPNTDHKKADQSPPSSTPSPSTPNNPVFGPLPKYDPNHPFNPFTGPNA